MRRFCPATSQEFLSCNNYSTLENVNDLFDQTPIIPESRVLREQLETLGNQLVWKIGKDELTERIIVRVAYANATQSFRDLPKLRSATDAEIAAAAKDNLLVVEWIE